MRLLLAFDGLRWAGSRMLARIPYGANFRCSICERRVRRFLPYRNGLADVPPLIRELAVVGSDVENFACPACGCHDRERHLLMYLEASGLLSQMRQKKILHFAPEFHLQKFIRAAEPLEYIQGDLYPTQPEIQQIDLQAVHYPENHFDFVLANHVLEHVQDDRRALAEIHRILRPNGHAILQTPYSSVLAQTFEDPGIQTSQACLHAYGQEDHRRLYGKDIFQRFEACGLRSLKKVHSQLLSEVDDVRSGVNPVEPFFVFQKTSDA
ncbi:MULTISPECIES: bifunctional 2-polyprenyl-6-hydroxyphenol methylase/3-demethylubiquinol 3-O-methyltransferase UbiG [unclassified Polaromonas]|uniref:class I SAM-dependent methyltransferase n=1 Tax=unclassified Polaromonas TaxID=2638319 RepID=UPI0013DE5C78|nr:MULTISPECIES: class I SAM-dependent methyltransferase [unclassified Polaromonas]